MNISFSHVLSLWMICVPAKINSDLPSFNKLPLRALSYLATFTVLNKLS